MMSTTRWLLWLAVFQTQALASVNQETSLLETRQIIPQLGRVPDPFWWTGSYSAATPQQIQYLDCNSTQINTLKAAVTATAQVASNLRAVLDNPGGDKTNAAMLNIIFGRAFTRRIRGKDYLARVRGAYDAISKGVAINPTSSQQWSSVRILCSADDKTITAWSFPLGALVTIPKIFFQVNLGDGTPCGAFNTFMPSSQLQVMMHELAHLAGVDRAEPEVYSIADALKLPPNAATLNAENYAFAALGESADLLVPTFGLS